MGMCAVTALWFSATAVTSAEPVGSGSNEKTPATNFSSDVEVNDLLATNVRLRLKDEETIEITAKNYAQLISDVRKLHATREGLQKTNAALATANEKIAALTARLDSLLKTQDNYYDDKDNCKKVIVFDGLQGKWTKPVLAPSGHYVAGMAVRHRGGDEWSIVDPDGSKGPPLGRTKGDVTSVELFFLPFPK